MKKRIILCLALAVLVACKKKKENSDNPVVTNANYILEVRNTGFDVMGLHPVEDITSGEVEIKDASEGLFSFYLGDWDANGAIFSKDYSPDKITKYQFVDGEVKATQSLSQAEGGEPHSNVRLSSTEMWSVRKIDGNNVYWDVINTNSMAYVNSGNFTLPLKSGYELNGGFANKLGNDKLVFGYHQVSTDNDEKVDSVYIAVLDASNNYSVLSLDKDERSAAAGYTYSSSSFISENGDLYFLTYPFAGKGNNSAKPSAVMRIKSGETTIDDSYFFDVTASVNNNNLNGPSIYMGNNKLLVQIVREDLVVDGDYWGAFESGIFQNEYYVLDIYAKNATKLDVPLSRGNGDGNPIKAGDNLYAFAVNCADGNFVYTYNTSTGETQRGIKYVGALVIYKLHSLK